MIYIKMILVIMAVMSHFSFYEAGFICFPEGGLKMVEKRFKSFLYVTL